MRSQFNDAYETLFSDFLHKNICCGYWFELPQLVEEVEASQMRVPTTYVLRKKYTGCNLNTKLLDCIYRSMYGN